MRVVGETLKRREARQGWRGDEMIKGKRSSNYVWNEVRAISCRFAGV